MESPEEMEGGQNRREGESLQRSLDDTGSSAREKLRMKVLVALDQSDVSFYALKWALDHLFPTSSPQAQVVKEGRGGEEEEEGGGGGGGEGTVIMLHVEQPFATYIAPASPAIYATTDLIESVKKAQEQNTAALLARALEICKGSPIKVKTMALNGDPKDTICQVAEQTHSDLVVVGSRGLGKIKRAFLGSVSDYCAHHAKCPVLIVKPPKRGAVTE